jgi:hypothetical protein
MLAVIAASPMTVQVLALVAAVLFLVAAVVALARPAWQGSFGAVTGLLAAGLTALAVAVVYLV